MQYLINAATDVGSTRENNQDSIVIQLAQNGQHTFVLAAVCDGMGGLACGEVASTTVACALKRWFAQQCAAVQPQTSIHTLCSSCAAMLAQLNERLKEYGIQNKTVMGTTMSCLLAWDDAYAIHHIGDSRIYKITQTAQQLTVDHTTAQKRQDANQTRMHAVPGEGASKLTQCMGASKRYEPQTGFGTVQKNDVFLLCSDGLRHRLTEDELAKRFAAGVLTTEQTIKDQCEQAIRCVLERGEKDNISVAVIKAK